MSVTKSESECTASATIAALCPTMPATNLKASSSTFTAPPHSVTLYISLFLMGEESFDNSLYGISCPAQEVEESPFAWQMASTDGKEGRF